MQVPKLSDKHVTRFASGYEPMILLNNEGQTGTMSRKSLSLTPIK
jgi:hypothetical protein